MLDTGCVSSGAASTDSMLVIRKSGYQDNRMQAIRKSGYQEKKGEHNDVELIPWYPDNHCLIF